MSAKELILEKVQGMPDSLTIEEILEELVIMAKIHRSEQAADEGRVISHEEMKKRVAAWNTN